MVGTWFLTHLSLVKDECLPLFEQRGLRSVPNVKEFNDAINSKVARSLLYKSAPSG